MHLAVPVFSSLEPIRGPNSFFLFDLDFSPRSVNLLLSEDIPHLERPR